MNMRILISFSLALLLSGCPTIGRHHIPAPEGRHTTQPSKNRVVVILLEGLGADALDRYVTTLTAADFQPDWRSGLSLILRSPNRYAMSERAHTVFPSSKLAGHASLVTGMYPGDHGVPGNVMYQNRPLGPLLRYDFDRILDQNQLWFDHGPAEPDLDSPPVADELLQVPTLFEKMEGFAAASTVFLPFGAGSERLLPGRYERTAEVMLPTRTGAQITPLLDRTASDIARTLLINGRPILFLTLRRAAALSCYAGRGACPETETFSAAQTEALVKMDGDLWHSLERYKFSNPDAFYNTTFIVTTSHVAPPREGKGDHARYNLDTQSFSGDLASSMTDACGGWMKNAGISGEIAIGYQSGFAYVYLADGPPGQTHHRARGERCMIDGFNNAIRTHPAIDAIAHKGPAGLNVIESKRLRSALPNHTKGRLFAKLGRLLYGQADGRTPDFVVFLKPNWVFSAPGLPYAKHAVQFGGLSNDSFRAPFLVAGRRLSEEAPAALRTVPIEPNDLAPTILSIIGAPPEQLQAFERPPALRWRRGEEKILEVTPADRQIRPDRASVQTLSHHYSEDASAFTFGFQEPKGVWPPDKVEIRIDDSIQSWDPDKETFPEGSPCSYGADDVFRRWSCTYPIDRKQTRATLAAFRRIPGIKTEQDSEFLPIALGHSEPIFPSAPKLVCAAEDRAVIKLEAQDEAGLSTVELHLAEAGHEQQQPIMGTLHRVRPLGHLQEAAACHSDPTAKECTVTPTHTHYSGEVAFSLGSAVFQSFKSAQTRPGNGPKSQHHGAPVKLVLSACNVQGRCTRTTVSSGTEYSTALRTGCPSVEN